MRTRLKWKDGDEKKVVAVIDEDLLPRAENRAASDSVPLSRIFEAALHEYLRPARRPWPSACSSLNMGVMQADASVVEAVMEEPGVSDG